MNKDEISRRAALSVVAAAAMTGCEATSSRTSGNAASTAAAPSVPQSVGVGIGEGLRTLGRTGARVEAVSLGGEGILRTWGREAEAVPMILEALAQGVRYCDTAPAYAGSQDYYGAAFRQAGKGAREKVFLASKTHERTRDAALRLLDESLRRLGTDHLDLWQLHDLRELGELDTIFGKGGAIEAVEIAKKDGRIRFVGITGHHDPAILVEAMRRYDVDTVLCAMNPADPARLPFLTTVVPEARRRGVGVIGMKVMAAGRILQAGDATPEELIGYGAHFADTVIVGMRSPAEVRQNLGIARSLVPKAEAELRALERRLGPRAEEYAYFKVGA